MRSGTITPNDSRANSQSDANDETRPQRILPTESVRGFRSVRKGGPWEIHQTISEPFVDRVSE